MFDDGNHDDCVDALTIAYTHIHARRNIPMRTYVPQGRIDQPGYNTARPGSQFGPPRKPRHNPIWSILPH